MIIWLLLQSESFQRYCSDLITVKNVKMLRNATENVKMLRKATRITTYSALRLRLADRRLLCQVLLRRNRWFPMSIPAEPGFFPKDTFLDDIMTLRDQMQINNNIYEYPGRVLKSKHTLHNHNLTRHYLIWRLIFWFPTLRKLEHKMKNTKLQVWRIQCKISHKTPKWRIKQTSILD